MLMMMRVVVVVVVVVLLVVVLVVAEVLKPNRLVRILPIFVERTEANVAIIGHGSDSETTKTKMFKIMNIYSLSLYV